MNQDVQTKADHCFLDEAGDTTFYGKGKRLIIGEDGVPLSFAIGMVKLKGDLELIRQQVRDLQCEIEADAYLTAIPSVAKEIQKGGFFFHATDDPLEVRERFFKFIKQLNCSVEIYLARKIPELYSKKQNGRESEFYADLLSHLIKGKLKQQGKLVLNIAARGNTTKNSVLESALQKARSRASYKWTGKEMQRKVVFNVQNHQTEPLLNIADYLCWPVQRIFERGEMRYYNFVQEKISLVVDLYDSERYPGWKNYYNADKNPLTAGNKLSPPRA